MDRPWAGKVEKAESPVKVAITNNSLQPNAIRSNGERNPNYESIFIFKNDFSALSETAIDAEQPAEDPKDFDFFKVHQAEGRCDVMCFHPRSDVTLATMQLDEVVKVIDQWISIIDDIGKSHEWVQIFENHGQMMGCSNAHPHCQIWSTRFLPTTPATKDRSQLEYYTRFHRPMLHDYAEREIAIGDRVVHANDSWVCLVPFWAEWPFETMIVPRRAGVQRLTDVQPAEVAALAAMMQLLLRRYNRLFATEFPYSMGWHGAPTGAFLDRDMAHWTLHAAYYPPLLRSATVQKFFVGFELFGEIQRDLTPERAAETLRNVVV